MCGGGSGAALGMLGLGKAVAWFPLMGGKGTEVDISRPGSAPELVTSPLPAWVQWDNDTYAPQTFPHEGREGPSCWMLYPTA